MSWRVAAACAVGTSHISTGLPCQDSVRVELVDTPHGSFLVAAVSDGAGSAAHADCGSAIAVTQSMMLARRFLENRSSTEEVSRDTIEHWLTVIQATIQAEAELFGHRTRDYACTWLLAVVGPHSAAFAQIGDGAIVVARGDHTSWAHIFWPQHGEYANTTNFVISPDARAVLEFEIIHEPVVELAMFSDGIENLVLNHAAKSPHSPFFNSMFEPVRKLTSDGVSEKLSASLAAYLSSEKICERTDDDKSLVLASRAVSASANDTAP